MFKSIIGYTVAIMAALMITTCGMKSCGDVFAGELSMGTSFIDGSHSEGSKTRCMNTGYGLDLGYEITPIDTELSNLLSVSLDTGVLLTYSNFETAYRETSTSPESDMNREIGLTLGVTAKPTVSIGRVSVFPIFGVGYDYNEPDDAFGFGITTGYGADIRITDDVGLGISRREFNRLDGTFYRYNTVTVTVEF